jgi:ParB family chromosome partitioning protein
MNADNGKKKDNRPAWAKAADIEGAEATRTDVWWVAPESCGLAGIDTDPDPSNALYDTRVHLTLRPEFVENVDQLGVKQACTGIVKDGRLWIDDGRQRVRAAREANRRRVARGDAPMKVRVIVSSETDPQAIFLLARTLNAFRQDDGPLVVARNFQRAHDNFGTTMDAYARAEGISPATLRGYIALVTKAAPVLLEAIDSGAVDTTKAMQIARLPAAEQGAAIETAATGTVEETRRKVNERKAAATGDTATARFSAKEIRAVAREVTAGNVPHMPAAARMVLSILNGEALPDEVPAWVTALLAAAGRS